MKRLGLILDEIIFLRGLGGGKTPDPLHAVALIEMAGVDGIVYTVFEKYHEQQMRDLKVLKAAVHSHFNLRLKPTEQMIQLAFSNLPEMITFADVQDDAVKPLNLAEHESTLSSLVPSLRDKGIVVNVFIDTDLDQIKTAGQLGCDYVELNAARLIQASSITTMEIEIDNIRSASIAAARLKLGVTATGPIDYHNVREVKKIEEIEEVNVGHAILARALSVGYEKAIRDFSEILKL